MKTILKTQSLIKWLFNTKETNLEQRLTLNPIYDNDEDRHLFI